MKSKTKKRLIAFMLCMVLVLSSTISAFADELQGTDSQNQIETMADPATEEAIADEPMAESLDASQEEQQPVQEEVQTPEETSEQHPDNAVSNTNDSQPEATDQSTISSEENNASDETVECEATQLKQKVDNGNHTKTTVVADIPAGAFHAHASEITMEVKRLSTEDVDDAVIVKLIKNALTTNTSLSNYVLYDVVFKVNGVETEPLKAIDVNFKGSGLKVKDTKKATAFYFAPAKSEDGIEEDLLVELPQREDKIKELLDAGTDKTREQIEDEFDFSELSVKDEVADELKMEVRKNQVYGCYVVEDKEENTATPSIVSSEDSSSDEIATFANSSNRTNGTVTITDSNGKLIANYTGTGDYTYVWYRSINNKDNFKLQERKKYTTNDSEKKNLGYDISEDYKELYVALNGGALGYTQADNVKNSSVYYQVKVYSTSDVENGVPKSNATALASSSSFQITSYYELQNGSFETPDNTQTNTQTQTYGKSKQYSNSKYKQAGGVWQTTGLGSAVNKPECDIEIVRPDNGSLINAYHWYGTAAAADGEQFAELNCEKDGALYQDVLTTPGETLNYSLWHRARGGNSYNDTEKDTMYVLIMSTALAKDITTQDKVLEVMSNLSNYNGAVVVPYTDAEKWTQHVGSYTVTNPEQYSTRFFFVSGDCASGSNTEGNFLDNIQFTRSALTPENDSSYITLKKSIVGLGYSSAVSLSRRLTFTVGTQTIDGKDLTWSYDTTTKTYTGSKVITLLKNQIKNGSIKVEEKSTTGSLDVTDYDRSTTLHEGNTVISNSTSGNITIRANESKSVEFTNTYTPKGGSIEANKQLTHEKYIKNNNDGTYDITLNVSGAIGTETNKAKLDVIFVMDVSTSMVDKITTSREAATQLLQILNKSTIDGRYKLITFGTSVKTNTEWSNNATIQKAINTVTIPTDTASAQGTNYQQGLQAAADALDNSSRIEARKIVIFLTDGQPTYHGESKGYSSSGWEIASGRGDTTSRPTLTAAFDAANHIYCDDFYAIGIGLTDQKDIDIYTTDDTTKTTTEAVKLSGADIISQVANSTFSVTKSAEAINLDQLTGTFDKIAGKITNLKCSGVKITDTLSDYVKTTDASSLLVKIAKKESTQTFTDLVEQNCNLTTSTEINLSDQKIATASYNSDTKTATLEFESGYELQEDYYYYITITNVTPTDTAFNEYANSNSYPNTGDSPTDANWDSGKNFAYSSTTGGSSSGKPGFYSNKEAKVYYTYNETPSSLDYDKPVVQIETIPVEKKWVGSEPNGTVLVQLLKDGKAVYKEDGTPKILELTKDGKWVGKFVVEKASNYTVRELTPDEKGSIEYNGNHYSILDSDGETTINNVTYKVSYSSENGTFIITNTENSKKIRIIKVSSSETNPPLKGAEFILKTSSTDLTGKQLTSNSNGTLLDGELSSGNYILEETKAPTGYSKLNHILNITVSSSGVTVNSNENVSITQNGDTWIITIKNNPLYNLPSTGGSGIYLYMIGGVLLMFAAAWILYKNKCREVLKR